MDNYTNNKEPGSHAIEAFNDFLNSLLIIKSEGAKKAELAIKAFVEFLANRPAT